MNRHAVRLAGLCLAVACLAVACAPVVGDKCERNSQCGTTLTCDTTTPEGYCLKVGCRKGKDECPPEAACIDFGGELRYCMRTCAPDDECREGLTCRPAPLCGQATATSQAPCSESDTAHAFCGVAQ